MLGSQNRLYSNQAQALLELAIFSSIILFLFGVLLQYGLSANYQENMSMTAFRNALALAHNRSVKGKADPLVNLSVINDKFIPQPDGSFGSASTTPVGAAYSSVVWSNRLGFSALSYDRDKLPGVDYLINGEWQTMPDKKATYQEDNEVGFTGAGWRHITVNNLGTIENPSYDLCNTVRPCRKKVNNNTGNIWWKWEDITDLEKVQEGEALDFDNDGVEEVVVEIVRNQVTVFVGDEDEGYGEDGYVETYSVITRIIVLDPKGGNINSAYGETVDIAGVGKVRRPFRDANGREIHQGLQSDHTKEADSHNSVWRSETPSKITTRTSISNEETVIRKILTQNGEDEDKVNNIEVRTPVREEINKRYETPF